MTASPSLSVKNNFVERWEKHPEITTIVQERERALEQAWFLGDKGMCCTGKGILRMCSAACHFLEVVLSGELAQTEIQQ